MKTQAIDRIKGFCCEVTQEQWEELVKVAGVDIGTFSLVNGVHSAYKIACTEGSFLILGQAALKSEAIIPFPDFLAKLRGSEEWQPKAGEYVNGSMNGKSWSETADEYIAYYCGKHVTKHMTVKGEWIACVWDYIRPLRPTITRADAEQQLGKRIID